MNFAQMLGAQIKPFVPQEKPSLRWATNRARYKELMTEPMTVDEIASALGQTRDGTRATISRMLRRGVVRCVVESVVTHGGRTPALYIWNEKEQ